MVVEILEDPICSGERRGYHSSPPEYRGGGGGYSKVTTEQLPIGVGVGANNIIEPYWGSRLFFIVTQPKCFNTPFPPLPGDKKITSPPEAPCSNMDWAKNVPQLTVDCLLALCRLWLRSCL